MLEACQHEQDIQDLLLHLSEASIRPNAAFYTTLHKQYVTLRMFESAASTLAEAQHQGLLDINDADRHKPFSIRILDSNILKAIATNTLKEMCKRGDEGRLDAHIYFESLCTSCADIVQVVHYGVMLSACKDVEAVQFWLDHMRARRRPPITADDHLYSITHKVYVELQAFDEAVRVLGEAHRREIFTIDSVGATATSALTRLMGRADETGKSSAKEWALPEAAVSVQGDSLGVSAGGGAALSRAEAEAALGYFHCLRAAGFANVFHYNVLLNATRLNPSVLRFRDNDDLIMELLQQMEESGIAHDDVTRLILRRMTQHEEKRVNKSNKPAANEINRSKTKFYD